MGRPKANTEAIEVESKNDNSDILKQNEMLQEQMRLMQEQMQKQMDMINTLSSQKPTVEVKDTSVVDMNGWVDIVHLQQASSGGSTHIEIPSRTIDFYNFGEVRSIRYSEFQELIGKYKSWFDKNIIALSAKDSALALKEGLVTDDQIPLKRSQVESLMNLTLEELEKLYNSLSESHKRFITRSWAYGYYEIGDGYKNGIKIELLNKLSNGAMENILKDFYGR